MREWRCLEPGCANPYGVARDDAAAYRALLVHRQREHTELRPLAGAPASSTLVDDRAISSGKRRASPHAQAAARQAEEERRARERSRR